MNARTEAALPPLHPGPPFRSHVVRVFGLSLAWCLFWWWIGPEEKVWHHYREGGPIDLLSSVFLGGASALAWIAWIYSGGRRIRGFWLVVAFGLLFFMFDERARLHELANDEWLIDAYGSAPFGLRNWNDLIVICYGIGGLACLLMWIKPVFQERRTRNLLLLGFLFYALHTGVDSVLDPDHDAGIMVKEILEESLKVFSGASLFLATLSGAFIAMEEADPEVVGSPPPRRGHAIVIFLALGAITFGLVGGSEAWQDTLEDYWWGSPHSWLAGVMLWVGAGLMWLAWQRRGLGKERGGAWWLAIIAVSLFVGLGEMGRATRATFYHRRLRYGFINDIRFDLELLHDPIEWPGLVFVVVIPLLAALSWRALTQHPRAAHWLFGATVLLLLSMPVNTLLGDAGNDILAPICRIAGGICVFLAGLTLLCGRSEPAQS